MDEHLNIRDDLRRLVEGAPDNLRSLPSSERDVYEFYVIREMCQKEIAKLLGMTQGAVSSKLKRMRQRLRFLYEINKYDLLKMVEELRKVFSDFDVELLMSMVATTCQSETARRLNELFGLQGDKAMNQVKTRHRYNKCMEVVKEKLPDYHDFFQLIKDNLYILHEVKLPAWDRGIAK